MPERGSVFTGEGGKDKMEKSEFLGRGMKFPLETDRKGGNRSTGSVGSQNQGYRCFGSSR